MARTIREQELPHFPGITAIGKRLACGDIQAAIRELQYITDPRNAGAVANIQDRLKSSLKWIGCEAETPESTLPGSGMTRSVPQGEMTHVAPDAVDDRGAHAFRDTLKKLWFVDKQPWMSDAYWRKFSLDPVRHFVNADEETADRLWDLIKPKE